MSGTKEDGVLVLLTGAFPGVGGIHAFNRALMMALDELASVNGWRVTVLSLMDGQVPIGMSEQYLPSGRVHYLGFKGNRIRFSLSALRKQHENQRVIFGHINLIPLALGMNGRDKYLVIHGVEVWKKISFAQRLGMSRVSDILSVSDHTAKRLVEINGVPPAQIHYFPNTLDPFYPRGGDSVAKDDLNLPPGRFLLSVTRLHDTERNKGIDVVIRAMPKIIHQVPDAYYVVVGGGNDRCRLEQLADDIGVGSRVIFTGGVSDDVLPAYYRECDLFILPSKKEGFGIVFLEAMFYGKACIGANAGGIPEVIDSERTGLLVPFGDPEAIASSVVRLLKNDDERREMSLNGKHRLEDRFLFPAFRRRLELILSR